MSSTSTNTPHIFNASLLPAPLPSHHPLLNFSTMFCKKCDFEQFCISDGFSHFSPSVPSSCSEPCQLPIAKPTCRFTVIDLCQVYLLSSLFACTFASRSSTLLDMVKQVMNLAKKGQITREESMNLQNCMAKCNIGQPGTPMDDHAAQEATRCAEVHTFSVTCTGCPKKMH